MLKNTTETPPAIANLKYCPKNFEKIIGAMGEDYDLINSIYIEVWAEFENRAVELMRDYIAPEKRAKINLQDSRMIFRGPHESLKRIGVIS